MILLTLNPKPLTHTYSGGSGKLPSPLQCPLSLVCRDPKALRGALMVRVRGFRVKGFGFTVGFRCRVWGVGFRGHRGVQRF